MNDGRWTLCATLIRSLQVAKMMLSARAQQKSETGPQEVSVRQDFKLCQLTGLIKQLWQPPDWELCALIIKLGDQMICCSENHVSGAVPNAYLWWDISTPEWFELLYLMQVICVCRLSRIAGYRQLLPWHDETLARFPKFKTMNSTLRQVWPSGNVHD